MDKPTSFSKSTRRHALKEIDKKWAGRKVSKPNHPAHDALKSKADKAIKHHEHLASQEKPHPMGSFESRLDKYVKSRK